MMLWYEINAIGLFALAIGVSRSLICINTMLSCVCFVCPLRLIDRTTRHRQETEHETERLRSSQLQTERLLEARKRAHRQRIKGLEEQVHNSVHQRTTARALKNN